MTASGSLSEMTMTRLWRGWVLASAPSDAAETPLSCSPVKLPPWLLS